MTAGWYIHLDLLKSRETNAFIYGPYWPKKRAYKMIQSFGRQYFVMYHVKFHIKKPAIKEAENA